MYKIEYLPTGHIFNLPDYKAQELKEKFPDEYKIISKNGKRFQDKVQVVNQNDKKSIYSRVVIK